MPSDFALLDVKTNYFKNIGRISIACLLCNVVEALAVERYVNVNNPSPAAPYLTWATAATTIQAAINAASDGDVITVTNGMYQLGASELFPNYGTNRVSISKAVLVQSVNGPAVTIINGGGTMRCVALVSNAVLSGFTLTNGSPVPRSGVGTFLSGGGAMSPLSILGQYHKGTLTNCILTGNRSDVAGGGAYGCTLNNCILINNVGRAGGGGAHTCDLNNCLITGNRSGEWLYDQAYGGGVVGSTLNNCIVSNNFASFRGGGSASSILNDCIIVNNVAGMYGGGSADYALTNCFIGGNSVSNINGEGVGGGAGRPHEAWMSQTFVNCVFVNNRVIGTNGAGGGVGSASLYNCAFTNNSASVGGGAWEARLSDCILAGNQATNGAGLGGGVAGNDARLERCLLLGNSAKNGGGVAGIPGTFLGANTASCVFGGNSASVAGGAIFGRGDHHLAIITNNFALDGGGYGGAEYDGYPNLLNTCQFSGNVATNRGGGVYRATRMANCTIAGNSAGIEGGGIYQMGVLAESIVYHNSAPLHPNYYTPYSSFVNSCTTPMPTPQAGPEAYAYNNFTDDPAFVNLAAGDYRLSSNSPCINYAYSPPPEPPLDPAFIDLDGNPRHIGGGIDLGAYEFQYPSSAISYLWLQEHGLPMDGSADYVDPDGDSFHNHWEWRLHTDPFDAASVLKIRSISTVTDPYDPWQQLLIRLEWQSAPGLWYVIERATNVTGPFEILDSIGAYSTNTVWEMPLDPAEGPMFFKLSVQ